MAGGTWTPGTNPGRPGLYLNFVEAAIDAISTGTLGVVAMPFSGTVGGTATPGNFYTVDNATQAAALFGDANVAAITYVLKGGAREVLVYVPTSVEIESNYNAVFAKYDTREFNIFVFDAMVDDDIQDAALLWMQTNRAQGKYFMTVFGCASASDDATVSNGIARSTRLADDFVVNLITGFVDGLNVRTSAQAAPYVAGLIASTPLNASTTYAVTPYQDVNVRLNSTEIKNALAAGCLVLVNDGVKVKIERGVCTSGVKIRRARTQMAVVTDVSTTANDSYIGKVVNNEDGRIALVSAIKTYLEMLAGEGVLDKDSLAVKLSDAYPSTGDQVYIDMAFRDLDSIEEIYLTVQIG
jgi:hypothetical protein